MPLSNTPAHRTTMNKTPETPVLIKADGHELVRVDAAGAVTVNADAPESAWETAKQHPTIGPLALALAGKSGT